MDYDFCEQFFIFLIVSIKDNKNKKAEKNIIIISN